MIGDKMQDMISYFVQKLTREEVNKYALKNNIHLSPAELDFTFNFIKSNYTTILKDPHSFDFNLYQQHYSPENFHKIKELIKVYANYL